MGDIGLVIICIVNVILLFYGIKYMFGSFSEFNKFMNKSRKIQEIPANWEELSVQISFIGVLLIIGFIIAVEITVYLMIII